MFAWPSFLEGRLFVADHHAMPGPTTRHCWRLGCQDCIAKGRVPGNDEVADADCTDLPPNTEALYARGTLVEACGCNDVAMNGAVGRVRSVQGELVKVHLEPPFGRKCLPKAKLRIIDDEFRHLFVEQTEDGHEEHPAARTNVLMQATSKAAAVKRRRRVYQRLIL